MFVHTFLHFSLDLVLDPHNLDFIDKFKAELVVPGPQVDLFEQLLLVSLMKRSVRTDLVHQTAQVVLFRDLSHKFLGQLSVPRSILNKDVFQSAHHRLGVRVVRNLLRLFLHLYGRSQIRIRKLDFL